MKIDAETLKKQVILHLPYLLLLLVFAKLGEAVRLAPGADASQKLLGLSEGFALAFQSMWPGAAMDWLIGFCGAAIMRLAVYLRGKDAKKYRKNAERCCSEAHQSWTRTESLCVMKKERSSMSPIKYGYSIRSISRKVCTLTRSPTFIPRKIF